MKPKQTLSGSLRVLYDGQVFVMQKHGGISRYFVELARHLHRLDIATLIACPIHQNAYAAELVGGTVYGNWVRHIPKGGFTIAERVNALAFKFCMQRFKPDIVHETYYHSGRKRQNVSPVVVTVYDMIHERFPECFPSRDSTRERKLAAVRRADHVICISDRTREDLLHLTDIPIQKTSVVHLGRPAIRHQHLAQPGLSQGVKESNSILYIGQRGGYKNFRGLVAAFLGCPELSRQYRLVAFGGGPIDSSEWHDFGQFGDPRGRIEWVSGDDDDLAKLFQRASLFVMPSKYEGFGLPPLEAMAYGCPVACSTGGSLPEIVGDAAEFFDARYPESIRQAIHRVLASEQRRAALIARGSERIKQFSWSRCAAETRDVYASLT